MVGISKNAGFAVMVVLIFAVAAVTAQDGSIAPSPSLDTGAGFAFPVSVGLLCSSLVFSFMALALVFILFKPNIDLFWISMAQINTSMATVILFVFVIFSAAAMISAQDAPAPAPSMDNGAGVTLPVSVAVLCSSLVLSLFGLFKH
ncbi:hypothetical protein NE237_005506 [Protea cynaroides]|uniref:NADH dehydrogenase subunit 6 n=1 Tax=Protea cynaroides TaxID=273540 RepID=A0A9Q0KKV3_9MAGN|nr:hypothetical protein NE237_005506 [Protea cynaroides]